MHDDINNKILMCRLNLVCSLHLPNRGNIDHFFSFLLDLRQPRPPQQIDFLIPMGSLHQMSFPRTQ